MKSSPVKISILAIIYYFSYDKVQDLTTIWLPKVWKEYLEVKNTLKDVMICHF